MKKFYINHPQDKKDAFDNIDLPFPYVIMGMSAKPTHGKEGDKWKRLNALFHRGIVPTFSELTGLDEAESKKELQKRFACVIEHKDYYEVESIGGMSVERLNKFIDDCQQFLIVNFGTRADELLVMNKTKKIKK